MLIILYYCLKVIICSGFLFGYYMLALRNNRFHHWNRYYLLAAVVVSFTLPFLRIPVIFGGDSPLAAYSYQIFSGPDMYFTFVQKQKHSYLTMPLLLSVIYLAVTVFIFLVFIKNLIRIQLLKKSYSKEIIDGINLYKTVEEGTPFSFFRNIFWNNNIQLNTEKGQQMLRHEMTHVQEKHSIDKVALEVLMAVAWWNPLVYFIRKELSVIHEFIADQKASAGDAKLQYASLLLMKAMGSEQYTLGNPFFHSQLKRRLTMLTTINNPKFSYVRRLMVLPLAVLAIALFSFKYNQEKKTAKQEQANKNYLKTKDEKTLAVHGFYEDTAKKKKELLKKEYKGSPIVIVTLTDDNKGVVVKTKNGKTYFLDRGQANAELGMNLNDNMWNSLGGAKVIHYDENGVPSDDYSLIKIVDGSKQIPSAPVEIRLGYNGDSAKPVVILNSIEIPFSDFNKIDPNSIKSVNVLKGSSAISKYGDKGKDGVIEIVTKESALPDNALYIVDYREVTKEQAEKLLKVGVKNLSVWKGEDAIKKFGDKGKNGVIAITTKLARNEVTFPETDQVNDSQKSSDVTVIGYGTKKSDLEVVGHKINKTDSIVTGYQTRNNIVFTKVEEPASFPGGIDGWRRYLERNLQYPKAAQEKGTQGVVRIQMLVNADGNVTELKALNNPGDGLADEAVRIIKYGPKWVPAKQNGNPVPYQFVQTITFQIQ